MARPSHREQLLTAGLRLLWKSGYCGASVRDIVAEAGVSPGSFTNHFASKEAFAEEVLDRYFDYVHGLVDDAMRDAARSPRARLMRFVDVMTEKLEASDWQRGCVIGNLSIDAPTESERLRARLAAVFDEWRTPFAACIAAGQACGEFPSQLSPETLADFFLNSWQGAILRMRVERSRAPLEQFKAVMFQAVLGTPTA